jgi:hypothetical protein
MEEVRRTRKGIVLERARRMLSTDANRADESDFDGDNPF